MAAVVANLTAVALLLHTLLGCCWHHTHACQWTGHAVPVADGDHGDCHGHAGHADACGPVDTHDDAGHEYPHPSKCSRPRCTIEASLTNGPTLPSLQLIAAAGRIPVLSVVDRAATDGRSSVAGCNCHRPAALRAHLLLQVLLV